MRQAPRPPFSCSRERWQLEGAGRGASNSVREFFLPAQSKKWNVPLFSGDRRAPFGGEVGVPEVHFPWRTAAAYRLEVAPGGSVKCGSRKKRGESEPTLSQQIPDSSPWTRRLRSRGVFFSLFAAYVSTLVPQGFLLRCTTLLGRFVGDRRELQGAAVPTDGLASAHPRAVQCRVRGRRRTRRRKRQRRSRYCFVAQDWNAWGVARVPACWICRRLMGG